MFCYEPEKAFLPFFYRAGLFPVGLTILFIYANICFMKKNCVLYAALRQVPNILTLYRVAAAVAILFVAPYETAFYVIYALAGVSDLFDGVIARALKSESRFGSTADTIGDVMLTLTGTAVVFYNMDPLDTGALGIVIAFFLTRVLGAVVTGVRFKKFAMLHTVGNKIAMIIFYLIPFFYTMCAAAGSADVLIYAVTSVCILAAIEEIAIQLIIPEFDDNVKSVVTAVKRRRELRDERCAEQNIALKEDVPSKM